MLKAIAFPTNELVAPDTRSIFSVSPVAVSPDGRFSVVDVLYSNDSGLSHAFMLVDLTDGSYLTNYNEIVGLGDITSIKASSASVAWDADMVPTIVLGYEDLSDAAPLGKDNRIGLVKGTTLFESDLIEAKTNTVSNGSIQNLIVETSGQYVAFETAATNLSPIGALDTNGLSDVYLMDTFADSFERISVLEDGTDAPSDNSELQSIALIDGKINILFSTTASRVFSASDINSENDLYLWRSGEISLVSSNSAGIAEGYNGGFANFTNDEITLIATDLIESDSDGLPDLYLVNTETMEKRVNPVVDALAFSSDHDMWIEGNNSSEIILGFQGVAQNSTDLSNQLLGVNVESGNSDIYTINLSGNLANDISDSVALSDISKTVAYRTSATNLAAQDSLAFIVNHSNTIPHGELVLLGSVRVGQTVSANLDDFGDVDGLGTFSYRWQSDGIDISGATFSSLVLGMPEHGKTITVTVSYIDGFGTTETITSEATAAVLDALTITTTITDRFGDAIASAEAHAYEDSVNEITATSTTDNVTVFETASGSDVLIDAAMDIDTASEQAIGAFDALQALRLAVGLDKSDGTSEWHDYIAADINKDGRVGADDALNILKLAVGLTEGPSADWVFVDGDADHSAIDRSNTDYDEGILLHDVMTDMYTNMTGILLGDVDGNYDGSYIA